MADQLYDEQLRWARMLRGDLMVVDPEKIDVPEIELSKVVREPLENSSAAPEIKPHTSDFGKCKMCRKHRRLWSGVCAWCGADPEEFEGEKQ